MGNKYVLDACALIAFLYGEEGGDKVKEILETAQEQNAEVYMNTVNILEVYYNIYKAEGEANAETFSQRLNELPVSIINGIDDAVFKVAGRLKSNYRMSLADSIAVSEAAIRDAYVLTSDHHEFDIIESNEKIKFGWIR